MKFFLIAFFVLSFISLANAQTWINEETDLYPVSVNIQQDKNAQGQITGHTTSINALGRKKNSDNTSFIARSYHDFVLNFPDNTQIDEVKVYYSTGSTGYSFKITKVSSISTTDLGANWNAIGSGNSMDQGISYNTGQTSFISSNIKTQMQNLLTGGKIILGALCENESADNSYSTLLIHLHVKYRRPANSYPYNALNYYKNQSGYGQIGVGLGVPPTSYSSPHQFSAIENQNVNLLAYDYQDINSKQYLYNDIEAPSNKSKWDQDLFNVITDLGSPQSITVVARSTNAGATFRAWLKQNCRVYQNYKTEFDGTIPGPISWIVEANVGQISAPGNGYKPGNITYNYVGWEDNFSAPNPRTVNPNDDESYTALYKYPHHSNSTAAYSSNSQRKFVQTPDGVKHMVYESMNKVWYELSTNGGATWMLGNGGKPLSSADSKNPSMSFYGNQIGIVWQEKSGSSFIIKLALFWMSDYSSSLFSTVAAADFALNYTYNASPVITWGYNGKVVVVWSGFDLCAFPVGSISLKYAYGSASSNSVDWIAQCGIDGTNENSINPTIIADYTDNISNPFNYHLAWEQVINTSNSKVNYCRLFYQNNNIQHSAIEEASLNSGYNKNYKPLLTLRKAFGFEFIYLSWLGYRQFASEGAGLEKSNFVQMGETRALVRYKLGANWSAIGVYGNSVASQSLNRGTTVISSQQIMGFAWSEYNGLSFVNKMMKFPVSQNIFTLNTTGKDLQVNNSVSFSDMFANSYQTVSSPFSFNLSQNFNSLNKENALMVYNGREGVVGRNDGQFYFALGDITVNGTNINFPQIPDSIVISTLAELNHYLTSESFNVDNNSSLVYGVQYGITDTLSCISALEDEREVKFRVELFDPMSNDILGVFDNVTFNENNVIQYENIGYQVDLTGIGNRTLKLRLVADYSPDFSFNLSDRYADESILAKNNLRTINYKGSLAVTEYALEQNYPNPFNPSTTIRYQLPQDGMVTLKVYDILGSEVAELVNEQKSAGRYEINFDASRFASGVYIYKITSGSYVSSKKMLLVK